MGAYKYLVSFQTKWPISEGIAYCGIPESQFQHGTRDTVFKHQFISVCIRETKPPIGK